MPTGAWGLGERAVGRGRWAVGYGCVLLSFGVSAEAKGETSLQLHFISNSRRGLLYLFIAFCFFWAIRSRTSLDALCLTIANQVKEDTDQDAPEGGINRAPRLRIPDPWGTSDQHLQRPLPEPYCFVFEYSDPLAVLLCWAKASVYRRGGTWGGRSGHTPETDAPCRTRKFC